MLLEIAKNIGFCNGVQRSVDIAKFERAKSICDIYTFGPLVHNEIVLNDLENLGIHIVDQTSNVQNSCTLIIRAHGIGKFTYAELLLKNIKLVDATCPLVKKIHNIVQIQSQKGRKIIIFGDKNHPEVIGIVQWCKDKGIVVESLDEMLCISEITRSTPLCLVSQTTCDIEKFENFKSKMSLYYQNSIVFDTVCNATRNRQKEADELSSLCDAMLIIGGHNSSNTNKLVNICQNNCKLVYRISDLKKVDWLISELKANQVERLGVISGASTSLEFVNKIISKFYITASKKV